MASEENDDMAKVQVEATKNESAVKPPEDAEKIPDTTEKSTETVQVEATSKTRWTSLLFWPFFSSKKKNHEKPSNTATEKGDGSEQEEKTKKQRWSLFSLPILKILQGIWLLVMIKNSLSGSNTSMWPFGDASQGQSSGTKISPFYAEMRSDLYGDEHQFRNPEDVGGNKFMQLFFGPKPMEPVLPRNTGIPKQQHIQVSHLNREYESYRYSVKATTSSKTQASHEFAQTSLRRALEKMLSRITDDEDVQNLIILEETYLEDANRLLDKRKVLRRSLVHAGNFIVDSQEQCGNSTEASMPLLDNSTESYEQQCVTNETETVVEVNTTNTTSSGDGPRLLANRNNATFILEEVKTIDNELKNITENFFRRIKEGLPPGPANAINDVFLSHTTIRGIDTLVEALNAFPMRSLLSAEQEQKKRLFVLYFVGDLFASQVESLRKEVTAILQSATPPDEVLVVLQSSGGTVTGYGLVAAQLLRIKEAGFRLTVAVEQTAASGGYLAASVAPIIICSPFAVVGSIGVITEVPNIHKRLKDEGVEVYSVTAGKYKRTLSPTKEVTPQDLEKAKDDLEEVHTLFKDFVKEHRPHIDLDVVATGEVWFGKRAADVGLCDAIQTADSVLMDYVGNGFEVYQVKHVEPIEGFLKSLFGDFTETTAIQSGDVAKYAVNWITQKLLPLWKYTETGNNPILMA